MCSPHFASCRGSYSPPLPWKPLCAQQCSVGDRQLQTWAPPSQLGPAAQCVPAKCCGCCNFPLLHLSDCLEEQRRLCQGEERSQERIPVGSCCRAGSPVALPRCFPCKPLQILICCISLLPLPAIVSSEAGASLCVLFRMNHSVCRKTSQTLICLPCRAASLAISPSWTPFPPVCGSSCCSPIWPSAASSSWWLGNVAAVAFPFLAVPSSVVLPAPW